MNNSDPCTFGFTVTSVEWIKDKGFVWLSVCWAAQTDSDLNQFRSYKIIFIISINKNDGQKHQKKQDLSYKDLFKTIDRFTTQVTTQASISEIIV